MSFEMEFRDILIRLAECQIDFNAWMDWWTVHSEEVKQIVSPGDYSRLNCAPSSYGPNTFMLKCQGGAERYLTKMEVSFHTSDTYFTGAEEEHRLYHEKLEKKRMTDWEKEQQKEEQKKRDVEELFDYKLPTEHGAKSGIRTLPIGAKKSEILKLLIEWTELLAKQEYAEALGMFQHYDYDFEWTPELLESAVYGYGCFGYTRAEAEKEFGSSDYQVTSLWNNPNRESILKSIDIDYDTVTEEQAKKGDLSTMDFENIMGCVHYSDVPLNEEASDLTAIFWIKKLSENQFTLMFYDLHMM